MIEENWEKHRNSIAMFLAKGDILNFANWYIVRLTMFCIPPICALEHLQSLADWNKWKEAIVESPVGNPEPYKLYPRSSGNLIAQANHLSHFLSRTQCKFKDLHTIFEFGAGYGCMCRLIYNLGFDGKYVIMDLPEMLELQRYYLGATTKNRDIEFLSEEAGFVKRISENNSLFIATWSLSEVDIPLRERILNAVGTKYILIAYQDIYRNFDNARFFSDFIGRNTNYKWDWFKIPHLEQKNSYYLFGERIEK